MSGESLVGGLSAAIVVLAVIVALVLVLGSVGALHAAERAVHMTPLIPTGPGRYA